MAHPIHTMSGAQEAEPFRFECATCGKMHDEIPIFAWDYPAQYLTIPEADRARRVALSDSTCVIDDEWFFIRGSIEIPVRGYREPLSYSVWLSVSRDSFGRFAAIPADPPTNHESYFGWLCTAIPGYPDTQLLKTVVHVRTSLLRPCVQLEASDHPLAIEQREGIDVWRVQQIVERVTHPHHRLAVSA
jgi:hypothetical protein